MTPGHTPFPWYVTVMGKIHSLATGKEVAVLSPVGTEEWTPEMRANADVIANATKPQHHFLIKFRATHRAAPEIVGVMRFSAETTYDQRQEALAKWREAQGRRDLKDDEAMWLDSVAVFDA